MACKFLTRLFRRRRQVPAAFSVPALPANANSQLSLRQLADHEDIDFFYLGCLAEQGSCKLVIHEIPAFLDTVDLERRLRSLPGFISLVYVGTSGKGTETLKINFATAEEAAMALATQPNIELSDGQRRHLQYENDADANEPARKRMKVEELPPPLPRCHICAEAIEGAFVKPCYFCKDTWCHECLQNQFAAALSDQESFPAKCCAKVFHFDIARTIISDEDHAKYRTRFEQYNTTKPVYCANVRCATFLPPRVAEPNEKGHVKCPQCDSMTCRDCKVVIAAESNHECEETNEIAALLNQYDYKRCPRCSAGIAKMYGCSHVRCQCGAHWCWDCQRPIQICWSKPCERAREDGEETDEGNSPEEESDDSEAETGRNEAIQAIPEHAQVVLVETAQNNADEGIVPDVVSVSQGALATTEVQVVTPADIGSETATAQATILPETVILTEDRNIVNLDGEDMEEWEAGSFNFGDEPSDESWDIWGCLHSFSPVINKVLWEDRRQWLPEQVTMTASGTIINKHLDCMKCYKTIILEKPAADTDENKSKQQEEVTLRADSACDVSRNPLEIVAAPQIAASVERVKKVKKKGRKKQGDSPRMYNCVKCGVFYCVECKKSTGKDIRELRDKHVYRL